MQAVENRETLYQCPFEPSHVIRKYRLQCHISKCIKNHPRTKKVRCVFDATHYIDVAQLEEHLEKCPTSGNIKNALLVVAPQCEPGAVPILEACASEPGTIMDEDWNGDHPSYDPMAATEDKDVLRILTGAPKSERRAFRAQERNRMSELERASTSRKQEPKAKILPDEPLRRPKAGCKTKKTNTNLLNTKENDPMNEKLLLQFDQTLSVSTNGTQDSCIHKNSKSIKGYNNIMTSKQHSEL